MSKPLPPGYSPPDFVISADDHAGWAVIAAGVGLVLVLLFASMRAWMRYPFRNGVFFFDDAIILIFAFLHAVLILSVTRQGFGKSGRLLTPGQVDHANKLLYADTFLYLLALFGSKISVVYLECRLSPERIHSRIAKAMLLFTTVSTVASIFMVAFGCSAAHPWQQVTSECGSLYVRWVVIAVCGIVIEVAIFALIARMFFALQRTWTGKLKGLGIFGLRLGVVVFTAFRLLALHNFRNSSDPTIDRINVVVWTEAEIAYSLVTATIPCLMPFMLRLNTGWGAFEPETIMKQSEQDSRGYANGSYALRSTRKHGTLRSGEEIRLDDVQHKANVTSNRVDQRSVASDDSTGLIIKKRVDVGVVSEPR